MANQLRNIHVKKIDLVGVPAIGRTITLFKSGDTTETSEEITVSKDELLKAISELTDEERQELAKSLKVEQKPLTADEILKALAERSVDEEKDEDIPESVRKSIEALEDGQKEAKERAEKAEAVVKEMRDEQRAKDFLAKAEMFKHLPNVVPAEFAPILSKIEKALKDEEWEKLAETLKAADAAIAEGDLFREIGRDEVPDAGGSALAQLNAKAEELRKANADLTKEQAFTQAIRENPSLYNADVREAELRKTRGED
jgi:hypothetical protein